jgi:hypothetical protein
MCEIFPISSGNIYKLRKSPATSHIEYSPDQIKIHRNYHGSLRLPPANQLDTVSSYPHHLKPCVMAMPTDSIYVS